jgi:Branched-chain amino acid transport system / permease component
MRAVKAVQAVLVLVVLAYLPYVPQTIPGLLPDRVNGPGSMQLLAVCLTMAGIALSYDVLFGRTGLLSFGHAFSVAVGSYGLTMSMASWSLPLWLAALLAFAGTTVLALVVGAISLRVGGIAFAMVTWPSPRRLRSSSCATPVTRRAARKARRSPAPVSPTPRRRRERAVPVLVRPRLSRLRLVRGDLAESLPRRPRDGRGSRQRGARPCSASTRTAPSSSRWWSAP